MVWLKINHNKWNVILKYKEQKVKPKQPWFKFMRICSWKATPTSKRGRRGADEKRQLWGKRSENNLRQNQSQGGHLRGALPVRALPALAIEAFEEPLILKGGFQDIALTCGRLFKLHSASVRSFSFKRIHCFQSSGEIHCGAKTRWENV